MSKRYISDPQSFNMGIKTALDILRQHFFAGSFDGGDNAIKQLEQSMIPLAENGIFAVREIPDSVKEEIVENIDILQHI
jgi:hypothetical protein